MHSVKCYANESTIISDMIILLFLTSRLVVTKRNWRDGPHLHETKPYSGQELN